MRTHASIPARAPSMVPRRSSPPGPRPQGGRPGHEKKQEARALHAQLLRTARRLHALDRPPIEAPVIEAGRALLPLVGLARDRLDLLLSPLGRVSGDDLCVLQASQAPLLAIALGTALGLPPFEILETARAALLCPPGRDPGALWSFARFSRPGCSSSLLLTVLLSEQELPDEETTAPWGGQRPAPLLGSTILRVAFRFLERILSAGGHAPAQTAALASLLREGSPRERALAVVLMNLLRVFPVGTVVRLDSGEIGVVFANAGDRPDRPTVLVRGPQPRLVDLSLRDGDRYLSRITVSVETPAP
ncbi:MAG: hypothetical protein U1E65_17210 [Myxococcota bacterium]